MDPSRPNEAAYAGIPTFGKLPLVLDPAGLAGVDVAIVGAPTDDLVSDRPGARFGPRAIRASDPIGWSPSMPNMDVGADPFEVLNVVDHGDVPTVPGYPLATHDRIRAMVTAVCAAGAIPIVLGGDHSIAHPDAGAVAAHVAPEPLGLIHFDAHADDADRGAQALARHAAAAAGRGGLDPWRAHRPDRPARLLAAALGLRMGSAARAFGGT